MALSRDLRPRIYRILFIKFCEVSIMAAVFSLAQLYYFLTLLMELRRSQWPRGIRRSKSAAARLLRTWVRIPPGAWTFVCCEYCVLLGRGLCDELITRLEESYRLWCVVVCDLENLKNGEAMTRVGSQRH